MNYELTIRVNGGSQIEIMSEIERVRHDVLEDFKINGEEPFAGQGYELEVIE